MAFPVREPGVHGPEHLGRFCDRGEPLRPASSPSRPAGRSSPHQRGTRPAHRSPSACAVQAATTAPNPWRRRRTGACHRDRHRPRRPAARRPRHRDRVLRKLLVVIAVGRRVRQAVGRADPLRRRWPSPEPCARPAPRTRRSGPARDQQDAGLRRRSDDSPGHSPRLPRRNGRPPGPGAGRRPPQSRKWMRTAPSIATMIRAGSADLSGGAAAGTGRRQGPQPGARERQAVTPSIAP